jgi:pimeloyl-ACP methyl ester carboxylesterase
MAPVPTIASTDAVQLALHDLGGEGPTILFSHATGLHGWLWAPLAHHLDRLPRRRRRLPGHGDATACRLGVLRLGRAADDCRAVVDALGDAGLLGVGHSMGAAVLVMTELAARHVPSPALYRPIVFPPGRGDDVGSSPIVEEQRRRRASSPHGRRRGPMASKPPLDVLDPEVLDLYVAEGFRDTPDGAVRLKAEPATEALTFPGSIGHDIHGRLAEVRCPVLVMGATPEEATPAEFAEDVATRFPTGSTTASTTSATSDRSRTRARWPP